MANAGVMRHLATPCALPAIAEEAKVHMNLISLVPWWQKTQMLVLVPGGGRDPEVLRRVVSTKKNKKHAVSWVRVTQL